DDSKSLQIGEERRRHPTVSYLQKRRIVKFPLYARALEFCAPEQDSFVRVTAMNVCMNLIRLAARCDRDNDNQNHNHNDNHNDNDNHNHNHNHNDKHDNHDNHENHDNELPTETPTGTLHEAPTLPLQDRIAIVRYACDPRRVADLVSPLCARLTSRFGQVEGTVRALEELQAPTCRANPTANDISPSSKNDAAAVATKRRRLEDAIRDLVANVQDELLLLDDLLKVGVVSLNEQAIELVLATFVYPMLLQPLLLPLHRFSSSKKHIRQRQRQPTSPIIALQSPEPLAPSLNERTTSSESDGEGSASHAPDSSEGGAVVAENTSATTSSNDARNALHSSQDMDLAPSKTALFGLCVVFQTVTNSALRNLLLTALLHPLSPEATGGAVVRAPPQVVVTGGKTTRMGSPRSGSGDVRLEIRMETPPGDEEECDGDGAEAGASTYSFGTNPMTLGHYFPESCENDNATDDTADHECIFILAPGLVELFQSSITGVSSKGNFQNDTRENPYRKILMSSVSGSEEMASLQSLATMALHAAVSSARNIRILRKIMFAMPCPPWDESHDHEVGGEGKVRSDSAEELDRLLFDTSENDIRTHTLESLCRGVVNKSVTYDGWWKAKFDKLAAKTLVDIVSSNADFLRVADTIISDVRMEAANFLVGLPSLLDSTSKSKDSDTSSISSSKSKPKSNPVDHQHIDAWLLDRFFFDQPDKSSISVVEHLCYLKEEDPNGDDSKTQYRYGLEVLGSASLSDACAVLCEDSLIIDNMIVSTRAKDTPFVCAASWALQCLTLDAFSTRLYKMIPDSDQIPGTPSSKKKGFIKRLSYVSEESGSDSEGATTSYSLAHVSSKFSIAMLDEGESSTSSSSKKGDVQPSHGSRVNLIGKTCFPCVCEVSRQFAHLFTGRTCVSNEGVQWQSLYLVFVGRWIVLAEPDRESSGGEGRVITSCRLACLAIKKDTTLINNSTPARRLLVAHSSLDPRPPALFVHDSGSNRRLPNLGSSGLRLTRSRMDLWFEDSNAAGRAWKVLAGKIAKARARRGARLRAALLAPR
ncbi:hypothetical protein ACHAXS_004125, partial [Conticribra weissflogii]